MPDITKSQIVREFVERLNIELLYLPPYSPNLNLIERLWKFVKKKCLYSKYYTNFSDLKRAITDCLNQTYTTYKSELDTLLTLRIQTFEKTQLPNTQLSVGLIDLSYRRKCWVSLKLLRFRAD